ncbi:4-alpha-glucanotransferase [Raineyella fluvialis]|uniref:4-alpha-glucanotransferase n=1 Tax=Raineyella fluvialis TaxID=2662261 RepID=A0A5Q2FDY6_9ACTN|nr:4-alpha-glucanotransferase [Raineyella fluvialis]QGF22476.1 4-alpha-glucanotransferase [Raineyella fluvialis]
MVAPSPQLHQLASDHGIATSYYDTMGHLNEVSAETLVSVLAVMGVDASTPEAAAAAIEKRKDDRWLRVLPYVVVMRQSQERVVNVHVPHGQPIVVTVVLEGGEIVPADQVDNWESPRVVDGVTLGEASFRMPTGLPLGYHRIRAQWDGRSVWAPMIVAPDRLELPERTWGPMVQLYSVRSDASWGIGDLGDLASLVDWCVVRGAGYVLTNPMHAAEPTVPQEPSPYLPTSRRFGNPVYLRIEDIPEYRTLTRAQRSRISKRRRQVKNDPQTWEHIDRNRVWPAKMKALRVVHEAERTPERDEAYRRYRFEQEEGLVHFARWMALATTYGADWRLWDAPLRDVHSAELDLWAAEHADEVEFQMWLQWVLDEQAGNVQDAATAAGMPIGVMGDLAVGVNEFGAETWANPELYARGVTVGAPPDPYNMNGQNWSQPPMRPDVLARQGYAPFRALVGTLLRHTGGLRVDHIIGLFRLWWIPEGRPATEGTYVYYDHEAMVGVLTLEAQRADAVIVGEDLGTVEPYVRDYLRDRGVLGTSILWWEKNHAGLPLEPEWYREACMASVTTHDLPPTSGYLQMAHVQLRQELGVLTRPVDEELAVEEHEQRIFLDACRHRGLLPADFQLFTAEQLEARRVRALRTAAELASRSEAEGDPADPGSTEQTAAARSESAEPASVPPESTAVTPVDQHALRQAVEGLYGYLVQSRARLLNVALTDLVGDTRIQNQPGTAWEYPNWRIPLSGPTQRPVLLEEALADERAEALAEVLRGQ